MFRSIAVASAVALAALAPLGAQAQTYTTATFSDNSAGATWRYGTGFPGAFNAFDPATSTCGPNCYGSGAPGYTQVAKSGNSLVLHPQDGAGAPGTVVQFNAPTAGYYNVVGSFTHINEPGNGVVVSIFNGTTQVFSQTLAAVNGASTSFNLSGLLLSGGSPLSFVVNNNGNYLYDSTLLTASVSAAPEPATWGLMILGFGAAGVAMRRSRKRATVAYA